MKGNMKDNRRNNKRYERKPESKKFGYLSVAELYKYQDTIMLVDVREKEEYEEQHIPNAIHIPLYNIEHKLCWLPIDRNIVVYCERGNLSIQAAKMLAVNGRHVWTLAGGIEQYRKYKA